MRPGIRASERGGLKGCFQGLGLSGCAGLRVYKGSRAYIVLKLTFKVYRVEGLGFGDSVFRV